LVLQVPPSQALPAAQSPSPAQLVRQAPERQVKAPQPLGAPAMHRAPFPGQVLAILLSPWQLVPQAVPIAATAHLPVPSQVPWLPHTGFATSGAQPPLMGVPPEVTFPQVPDAQVLQPEQDETLQQTPSTQNCGLGVCLQSLTSSQGPPGPDWPHLPL
jgi:hypothetical protein